jgi:hypothetical protein
MGNSRDGMRRVEEDPAEVYRLDWSIRGGSVKESARSPMPQKQK